MRKFILNLESVGQKQGLVELFVRIGNNVEILFRGIELQVEHKLSFAPMALELALLIRWNQETNLGTNTFFVLFSFVHNYQLLFDFWYRSVRLVCSLR